MKLLNIYFSDAESYYKVKSLAKNILDNPNKLLFFIKTHVIRMCECTHFEDCVVYYWYDLHRNNHYVNFRINDLAGIKIYISDYELRKFVPVSF